MDNDAWAVRQETSQLELDLAALLNRHSAENASDTPDFVLASYLYACLCAFDHAVYARERWYGRCPSPRAGSGEAPTALGE